MCVCVNVHFMKQLRGVILKYCGFLLVNFTHTLIFRYRISRRDTGY